ncbi:hypothetical protein LMG26842_05788 [Achromobacter dolens]|nr:hypothetical protein LMG26842_05788 [Achromobacter dolens]
MEAVVFLLTAFPIALLIAFWLACAFLAHHIANAKGLCGACWFLWGILLGPLALLTTIGMPDLYTRREIVQVRYAIEDATAPVESEQQVERTEPSLRAG